MKRQYQIDQQRAVQEFGQLAREQNPDLQMIFPLTEVVGLLHEGVGRLMREAGFRADEPGDGGKGAASGGGAARAKRQNREVLPCWRRDARDWEMRSRNDRS